MTLFGCVCVTDDQSDQSRLHRGRWRRNNPRLFDVTMALCVEMLISGKLAKDDAEARAKLQAVLDNGKAAEVFGRMVAAQKGRR